MIEDDPRVRRWMFWTLVALSIILLLMLAVRDCKANQVNCGSSPEQAGDNFYNELQRVNACTTTTVGTCSGTPGTCSNGGMTCNVATQSTDCDCTIATGRYITFSCAGTPNTFIEFRDVDASERGCGGGTYWCACDGNPISPSNACNTNADCSGGAVCVWNDHLCHNGSSVFGNPPTAPTEKACDSGDRAGEWCRNTTEAFGGCSEAYRCDCPGGGSCVASPGYCSGYNKQRNITADNVTIDGGSAKNLTFRLDPPCWARQTDSVATEMEQWYTFLTVKNDADNVTIKNLTFESFGLGIQAEHNVNNLDIQNVDVTKYMCDDWLRVWDVNLVMDGTWRDSYLFGGATNAVDKALTVRADETASFVLDNIYYAGSNQYSVSHQGGALTIKNSTFDESAVVAGGLRFRAEDENSSVTIQDSVFEDINFGLAFGDNNGDTGDVTVTIERSRFEDVGRTAIVACNDTVVSVSCSEFISNGTNTNGFGFCRASAFSDLGGAIAARQTATVNAGATSGCTSAGTSTGNNYFLDNGPWDLNDNAGSNCAESNCFSTAPGNCSDTPTVSGTWDTDPTLSTPPSCIGFPGAERCDDSIDNNGDGNIDCADSLCADIDACAAAPADDLMIITDVRGLRRRDANVQIKLMATIGTPIVPMAAAAVVVSPPREH